MALKNRCVRACVCVAGGVLLSVSSSLLFIFVVLFGLLIVFEMFWCPMNSHRQCLCVSFAYIFIYMVTLESVDPWYTIVHATSINLRGI